ncbi:MAG: type III polyketide synthase [Candidatus Eremiobacteraeota bacterium]|nr:type III polyketide synthase [Candidatus Eremiobacteraeota bacterium]
MPTFLIGLATAVPEHEIDQQVVAAGARALFAHRMHDYDRVARVFTSTGIERRYSVRPLEWFLEPHGWPDRTAAYLDGACSLYERVAKTALESAKLRPADIDAVVTISSTGIATPSLETRVLPGMGFRPETQRIPVFGLGCAGGVSGLALASRLAAGKPDSTVLLVSVELCTLSFRLDRPTKADVIATSLFGDGAAAAILTSRNDRPSMSSITGAAEHLWPSTLDIMGWATDDIGFGVVLSRSLPSFIAKNYREVFNAARSQMGMNDGLPGRVVCHPGGTKVIDAIELMLELAPGSLNHERAVMREYGNMSAPTVFFVLERVLAEGLPQHAMLAALGPGFTASFVRLEPPAG